MMLVVAAEKALQQQDGCFPPRDCTSRMLASRHQASPYSLERQAAAEQRGEYLRATDTAAVALIHLSDDSAIKTRWRTQHSTSQHPRETPHIHSCFPAWKTSLAEADGTRWAHPMKPLPLYSDIRDNLAELHPSLHDNSFIRRRNVYIQYIPPTTPLNLSEYCWCFMHTTDKPDYVEACLWEQGLTNTKRSDLKQKQTSFFGNHRLFSIWTRWIIHIWKTMHLLYLFPHFIGRIYSNNT